MSRRAYPLSQLLATALILISSSAIWAQTPDENPTFSATYNDAITGDAAATRTTTAVVIGQQNYNALGNGGQFSTASGLVSFDIDEFQPGSLTQRADDYLNEVYERPTDQTYFNVTDTGGNIRFGLDTGGVKYYSYLDIDNVRVGFDDDFLYVSMDLFGLNSVTTGSGTSNGENKLQGFYGFRIGNNPTDPQSSGGYFVRFQSPTDNAATTFGLDPTASVFADVNDNVGGNSINGAIITSTMEGGDVTGDGFEVQCVADGITNGNAGILAGIDALFTRINPLDNTVVDFALDYSVFGLTQADLANANLYLLFQATEVRNDAGDPFWNDHYNFQGAGTPNPDLRGFAGPNSSYLTTGLSGNIYRVDTLLGGGIVAIPEPGTGLLIGCCALALGYASRRRLFHSK